MGPLTQAEGEGNRGSPVPRSGLVFVFFTGSKQTNRKKANQCLRKGAPPALARFCGSLRRALLQSACSPPSGGTCRRRSDSLLGATHGRGLCTDLPEVGWSLPYPGHCPSPHPPPRRPHTKGTSSCRTHILCILPSNLCHLALCEPSGPHPALKGCGPQGCA